MTVGRWRTVWGGATCSTRRQRRITVMTANVFSGRGKRFPADFHAAVARHKPDVLLVQEAVQSHNVPGYECSYECGDDHNWMAAFVRLTSPWSATKHTTFESASCTTTRNAAVLHVASHGGSPLRIANVHLCGGRFDERYHTDDSAADLEHAKNELLRQVLAEAKPVIVAGDFNSDMNHYVTGEPRAAQATYLKMRGWSDEHIAIWNQTPYALLAANAYAATSTDAATTSWYGGTPDAIWYHTPALTLRSQRLVPLFDRRTDTRPTAGGSDHNGLVATFDVQW